MDYKDRRSPPNVVSNAHNKPSSYALIKTKKPKRTSSFCDKATGKIRT